jgi:hypothetical protein
MRNAMRTDPRHLAKEAALRERRARVYLIIITSSVILLVAFGFIWLTW